MKILVLIVFAIILFLTIFTSSNYNKHEKNKDISNNIVSEEVIIKEEINIDEKIIEEIDCCNNLYKDEKMESNEIPNNNYLLSIDNPDNTYTSYPIILSNYDREQLAHLVMGEFGTGKFIGCALIAQSVRDAMVKFGYVSIDEVIRKMQYSGWYNGQPSDFAYEAIDYIFTEGKAVVQHEILVMYAANIIYSGWHEAQEFVVQYENVRFFDY